jgi:gliding motility-associated-like protein
LCQGTSYILPDNRTVSNTGRYDVSFQTPTGCDSTIFFDIRVFKKPSDLMPIADTCLGSDDSLTLTATKGFETYNWMGISYSEPAYKVYKEGAYYVSVNNYCGTKTDTVHVYKNCDYPIYMPAAFTPNGDGLNDIFRVPPQNKNRLIQLTVYNRLGLVIFTTSDKSKGWNGYFEGHPADNGVYIYLLRMAGISGKAITQKGAVVLMR